MTATCTTPAPNDGDDAPQVLALVVNVAGESSRMGPLSKPGKIGLADHEITPTGGFHKGEPFNLSDDRI